MISVVEKIFDLNFDISIAEFSGGKIIFLENKKIIK